MYASIVEEHALEAAFCWETRDRAATADNWDAGSLGHLDGRVEAHLDGLRIAGDLGHETAGEMVTDEPGTVFVAACLAAEAGDLRRVAALLDLAVGTRPLERALVGALAWIAPEQAARVVEPMLAAGRASLGSLGIAACTAQRRDPGPALVRGLLEVDAELLSRSLRAAGKLGRADLRAEVHAALASGDARVRIEAALAATLLGDSAAAPLLWQAAEAGGPDAERAVVGAVARTSPEEASWRLQTMSGWPDKTRTAVVGARALGDPAALSWLSELAAAPEHARVVASAIAAITGVAIEGALAGAPPDGGGSGPDDDPANEDVSIDRDEHLAWPDPQRLRALCEERRASMRAGTRHVLGRPWDVRVLEEVLASGSQRVRSFAAFELAVARPGAPMAEPRARADRARRMS